MAPRRRHVSAAVALEDGAGAKAIVEAAIEVMSEHGYHGTSVRDIAERAGLSSAALYHHFSSKQDLLFSIMERGIDALVHATEAALLSGSDDPGERLRRVVRVHVLAHTEDQKGSFIGNSELRSLAPAHRAVIIAKRDQQQRIFDRVVADGLQRGAFVTPHPKEASRAIASMCTAVAGWYRPGGALRPEQIAARYADLALAMLGQHQDLNERSVSEMGA